MWILLRRLGSQRLSDDLPSTLAIGAYTLATNWYVLAEPTVKSTSWKPLDLCCIRRKYLVH